VVKATKKFHKIFFTPNQTKHGLSDKQLSNAIDVILERARLNRYPNETETSSTCVPEVSERLALFSFQKFLYSIRHIESFRHMNGRLNIVKK